MKSFSHLSMPHNSKPLCVHLGIVIFRASQGKIRPLNSKSSGANVHLLAWKRVPFRSKQTILWRAIISISGRRLENRKWRWEFSVRCPRGVRRSSWGTRWYFSGFSHPALVYTRGIWIPCHVALRLRVEWRWILAHTGALRASSLSRGLPITQVSKWEWQIGWFQSERSFVFAPCNPSHGESIQALLASYQNLKVSSLCIYRRKGNSLPWFLS